MPTPATSRYLATASTTVEPEEDPGDETEAFVAAALSHGDSFTPVPPPAAAVAPGTEPGAPGPVARKGGFRRPSRRQLVLAGVGLVLVLLLITAAVLASRPGATASVAARVLTITKADDFDPKADGGGGAENPQLAKLAIDGDPKTFWRTERYRRLPTLGGLKPGVGLVVDLGAVRNVSTVEVLLSGEGTNVEVRVPKANPDAAPMKSADQWKRAAGRDGASGTVPLAMPQPQETRYLLVYLTSLPPVGDDYFRGGIAEITVSGT